jgi:hypothetical protein
MQNSISLLNNRKEQCKTEIMETIPFIIPLRRTKYLGINLTEEV